MNFERNIPTTDDIVTLKIYKSYEEFNEIAGVTESRKVKEVNKYRQCS